MKANPPARGSKSLLVIMALTAYNGEFAQVNALSHQSMNQQSSQEQGIFDRLEKKINEKDQALAEAAQMHAENMAKAEQEAAIIAAGQVDPTLGGAPATIDDQLQEDFNRLDQTSIKKLAGMKENTRKDKMRSA